MYMYIKLCIRILILQNMHFIPNYVSMYGYGLHLKHFLVIIIVFCCCCIFCTEYAYEQCIFTSSNGVMFLLVCLSATLFKYNRRFLLFLGLGLGTRNSKIHFWGDLDPVTYFHFLQHCDEYFDVVHAIIPGDCNCQS